MEVALESSAWSPAQNAAAGHADRPAGDATEIMRNYDWAEEINKEVYEESALGFVVSSSRLLYGSRDVSSSQLRHRGVRRTTFVCI